MRKKGLVIPFCDYNNAIEQDAYMLQEDISLAEENDSFEETLTKHDELFVNMSHELKTPLNVIFSATQLMEMSLTDDTAETNKIRVLNSIDSIKQNCYRLTKLINNMIDLSKIGAGNMVLNINDVNIVELTENLVQASSGYVKGKKLSIIFDTNVENKIVACDEQRIERVILNLISNSIKFSNPGGSIHVNIIDKGDKVEVSVSDNGIGIDEENLKNIFSRFSQVDKSLSRIAEGSGMGLSLVKSIVEMHGGKISVQSKSGVGSIFKFELPTKLSYHESRDDKVLYRDNKSEIIKIEFSDIGNER